VRIHAAGKRRAPIDPRSFEGALEALLDELRVRWYSKQLLKQVRIVLLRFFAFLRAKRVRDLRAVSEAHVVDYARIVAGTKTRKGTCYTAATQRSYMMTVQRLFRFLVRQAMILQDPTLNLVLPSWKKLPRAVLNQAHARRLVACPDPITARGKRDRALLELLYGTAIRVGECERLNLKDLDLAKGLLMIRSGKGRKDRVVPVVGRAAAALDVYLRESRPELVKDPREGTLFITSWGTRLNTKRIQDLVRSNAKAAGIDIRVTPHTLRHGCATHLLQGGADVRHVQKLLGHSNVQTTAIYTHVDTRDLARVMERAHPRERAYNRPRKRASWRTGGL
jgi:integrase/recombinase XerD